MRKEIFLLICALFIIPLWSFNALSANTSISKIEVWLDRLMYPPITLERGFMCPFEQENKTAIEQLEDGQYLSLVNAFRDINKDNTGKTETFCGSPLPEFYKSNGEICSRQDENFPGLRKLANNKGYRLIQQVCGTPYTNSQVFTLNPLYLYHGKANYYPLPIPQQFDLYARVVADWMKQAEDEAGFPSIWVGTQEPDHTLGFINGIATQPGRDNNLIRYVTFWTIMAKKLKSYGMTIGGIQQNHAGQWHSRYKKVADALESQKCPIDFFTIQNYSPKTSGNLIKEARKALARPYFSKVPMLFNHYVVGCMDAAGTNQMKDGADICYYLNCEEFCINTPDLYGYCCGFIHLGNRSRPMAYELGKFLAAMPSQRRPISIDSDGRLKGFASGNIEGVYVVLWNNGVETHYIDLNLNNITPAAGRNWLKYNLDVRKGKGYNLNTVADVQLIQTSNDDYKITGFSLEKDTYALIRLTSGNTYQNAIKKLVFAEDHTWCSRLPNSDALPKGSGHYRLRDGIITVGASDSTGVGLAGVTFNKFPLDRTLDMKFSFEGLPVKGNGSTVLEVRLDYVKNTETMKTVFLKPDGYVHADLGFWKRLDWKDIVAPEYISQDISAGLSMSWNILTNAPPGWINLPEKARRFTVSVLLTNASNTSIVEVALGDSTVADLSASDRLGNIR